MPDNNSLLPEMTDNEKKKDPLAPEDTIIAIVPEKNNPPEIRVISPEEAEKIFEDIPKNDDGSFKECNIPGATLEGITQGMLHIIDSMKEQPSKFSRAAAFWGEMPIWQKIGIGLIITIPFIVVAAFTQMLTFAILCFVTASLYAGLGLLFNDHQATNKGSLDRIKIGIDSLAKMLTGMFLFLQNLCSDLGISVDELKGQNHQFEQNNFNLAGEVSNLSNQNNQMNHLVQDIEKSSKGMKDQSNSLIMQIQGFFTQLKQTSYDQKNQFTDQIDLLTKARDMYQKLWEQQLTQLASLIKNEELKQEFLTKLDKFIHDEGNIKENMKGILDSIYENQEILKTTNEKLEKVTADYQSTQQELKTVTQELREIQTLYKKQLEELGEEKTARHNNQGFFNSQIPPKSKTREPAVPTEQKTSEVIDLSC